MRIFAQKPTAQAKAIARPSARRAHAGRGASTGTSPHREHDFGRISSPAGAIQAKPAINKPGDEYEQEADRVAGQVMRMPVPRRQHACPCGGGCPGCRKHPAGEGVQTKRLGTSEPGAAAAPPIVDAALRSTGQPLDATARHFMEPRFGHDFSGVRVHTDETAARSAQAIQAAAYTSGRHVVFGKDKYGLELLAHELTHVVQQQGDAAGRIQRAPSDDASRPAAAANAYSGIDPYFMVEELPHVEFSDPRHKVKAGDYMLVPSMLGTDPPTVAYYIAYRRSGRRNEWVVGPDSVDQFVNDVENYERMANIGYAWVPPGQDVPAYQAHSARAVGRAMEGDVGGYFSGVGDAWGAAARDPGWWAQVVASMAGAVARVPAAPRGAPAAPLRVIPGGGAAAPVAAAPRAAAPALATEGNLAVAPRAAAAQAPAAAPHLKVLPGGGATPAPAAVPPAPALAAGATAGAAAAAPGTSPVPVPAPESSRREEDRGNECRQLNPSALECDDVRRSDMEEVVVEFLMNEGYSFEDLGDCRGMGSFGSGQIHACMGAPGERWHCRVNGTTNEISVFGCLCCHPDGRSDYEWRGAHWSER